MQRSNPRNSPASKRAASPASKRHAQTELPANRDHFQFALGTRPTPYNNTIRQFRHRVAFKKLAAALPQKTASVPTPRDSRLSKLRTPTMKLLLYVTTQLSMQHRNFLTRCWGNTTAAHPALSQADVLFFAPESKWPWLRARFPHALYNAANEDNRTGHRVSNKNIGAIEAMTNPRSREIFRTYDWIILLNPDVVIYSFDPIYQQMTDDTDAVVGMCDVRVMTDFTVFRPRAIDMPLPAWTAGSDILRNDKGKQICDPSNPECKMTRVLYASMVANRTTVVYRSPYRECRFRWEHVIIHTHDTVCAGAWTTANGSAPPTRRSDAMVPVWSYLPRHMGR